MKLTFLRKLEICFETLFARSGHAHAAQEKQLSTFLNGYRAGLIDKEAEWQPIETAPKDGTSIIVRLVDKGESGVEAANAWFDGGWRRIDYSRETYEYFSFYDITHWLPVPELSDV